jgi:hypothetical protein
MSAFAYVRPASSKYTTLQVGLRAESVRRRSSPAQCLLRQERLHRVELNRLSLVPLTGHKATASVFAAGIAQQFDMSRLWPPNQSHDSSRVRNDLATVRPPISTGAAADGAPWADKGAIAGIRTQTTIPSAGAYRFR